MVSSEVSLDPGSRSVSVNDVRAFSVDLIWRLCSGLMFVALLIVMIKMIKMELLYIGNDGEKHV